MKVVINSTYGGFSLSMEAYHYLGLKWDGFGYLIGYDTEEAIAEAAEKPSSLIANNPFYEGENLNSEIIEALGIDGPVLRGNVLRGGQFIDRESQSFRTAPNLVKCVEELGEKASGFAAHLTIVDVPDDVTNWHILDYDGLEHVAEDHRTWY